MGIVPMNIVPMNIVARARHWLGRRARCKIAMIDGRMRRNGSRRIAGGGHFAGGRIVRDRLPVWRGLKRRRFMWRRRLRRHGLMGPLMVGYGSGLRGGRL